MVWERLRIQLGDDATLLANLRLTDEEKDHELDLVVLLPGAGIVVVEVKGGSVSVDGTGAWRQGSGPGRTRRIWPVDQAMAGKHALRKYVEADPRWRDSSRTRVRWAHGVVTAYSRIADDFATPECPRWMVHDADDLGRLAERLRDSALRQESGFRVPDEDDLDLVVEILRGRHLPAPSVVAEADEREDRADRLTQEQALLLKVTRLLRRVEIRGGAGSGKTVLALTQAKELTRGAYKQPTQRVALLCYSMGLAAFLTREVAAVKRQHQPAFVGTFHELGRRWGAPDGDRTDSDFWENRLPTLMAELAQGLSDREKFDAIVVDEAQDFAQSWWTPLLAALRDPDEGGLYVYSDENQRIFPRFGRPPIELVPLVLDHNLRNTTQIGQAFAPLTPMRMRLLGGDGPEVTFVPCAAEDALDTADDQVDLLLEEGWEPGHVALLTTGSRHPMQVDQTERRGYDGYWETFWDAEEVFYGTVLGCKGLERRAVVLCVNQEDVRDRSRERLYVGLSRATDRLVVVGDPGVVREMGGDEVARNLGVPTGKP
ncbi:nuclease-related domain-containing DEAD/DEAH box helicase [Ornithinicoccus hortensis]|nr:NERD domain-containing protein [Ornithinicoccus hortensis]